MRIVAALIVGLAVGYNFCYLTLTLPAKKKISQVVADADSLANSAHKFCIAFNIAMDTNHKLLSTLDPSVRAEKPPLDCNFAGRTKWEE